MQLSEKTTAGKRRSSLHSRQSPTTCNIGYELICMYARINLNWNSMAHESSVFGLPYASVYIVTHTHTHIRNGLLWFMSAKLKCALTRMHSTEFSGSGGLIFFAHIKWFLRHIKFTTLPRTFPTRYSQILFSFSLCNTYPHTHTHTRGSWVYFSLKRIKILNSKARPLIPTLVHTYTHTHIHTYVHLHKLSLSIQ